MCSNVPPYDGDEGAELHRPAVPAGSQSEDLASMPYADDSPEMQEVEDLLRRYASENLSSLRRPAEIAYPLVVPSPALTEDTGLFRPVASRSGQFRPAPTARIADGTDALPVGRHRAGGGRVYRSRSAGRWWRRKIWGIPFAVPIAIVLIPSVALALTLLVFNKKAQVSVHGAGVGADGGWSWQPTSGWTIQAGYDAGTKFPHANFGNTAGGFIPDNSGQACAVKIQDPGAILDIFIDNAVPGGECMILAGLRAEPGARVATVGTPEIVQPSESVLSVRFATPEEVENPTAWFSVTDRTNQAEKHAVVRTGDTISPGGSDGKYTVPIVLSIPSTATPEQIEASSAQINLPLTATQ